MDRFTQFALAAAGMAIEDAALDLGIRRQGQDWCYSRISGIGGIETLEDQAAVLASKGPGRVSPFSYP